MNITRRQHSGRPVMAADEDVFVDDDELLDEDTGLDDSIDDLKDKVDDVADQIDDVDPDEPGSGIEMDNNITNHYIAECDRCKGVFISAVVASDQVIEKVTGTCPLCDKDTDQYLKWIIKDVSEEQ